MPQPPPFTATYFNQFAPAALPPFLGFTVVRVQGHEVEIEFEVAAHHLAPNGFLHGGTVVALADTCAGYGALTALPEAASGFTTLELKTNFLGTATQGKVRSVCHPLHLGRTTQVWEVQISSDHSGKTIAVFGCTQLVLYPKD